jgi:hypothetical protein
MNSSTVQALNGDVLNDPDVISIFGQGRTGQSGESLNLQVPSYALLSLLSLREYLIFENIWVLGVGVVRESRSGQYPMRVGQWSWQLGFIWKNLPCCIKNLAISLISSLHKDPKILGHNKRQGRAAGQEKTENKEKTHSYQKQNHTKYSNALSLETAERVLATLVHLTREKNGSWLPWKVIASEDFSHKTE